MGSYLHTIEFSTCLASYLLSKTVLVCLNDIMTLLSIVLVLMLTSVHTCVFVVSRCFTFYLYFHGFGFVLAYNVQ